MPSRGGLPSTGRPEPNQPDLDARLRATRVDLLCDIAVPELDGLMSRARTIRRRRRVGASVAALALVGVAAVGVNAVVSEYTAPRPQPVASAPVDGARWEGAGLTLFGIDGPVVDLSGTVVTVEFANAQRGYALAAKCDERGNCSVSVAATDDGGQTWLPWPSPVGEVPKERIPRLVAVGSAGLALVGDGAWFTPIDERLGQPQWAPSDLAAASAIDSVPAGARLLLGPTVDGPIDDHACTPGPVMAWLPDGKPARLANQPDIEACRVAPAPTPEGAWWVSGRANGLAAVAVTRDGGHTWASTTFPDGGPTSWAQVSTLGSTVYAAVVTATTPRSGEVIGRRAVSIRAVYRSAAGSGAFEPHAPDIGTAIGDVVPLVDGRLLAAGPHWYVTDPAADRMRLAGGSLPWVGRFQRTPGGWVAYDLFEAGWVAISRNGTTWEKINLH